MTFNNVLQTEEMKGALSTSISVIDGHFFLSDKQIGHFKQTGVGTLVVVAEQHERTWTFSVSIIDIGILLNQAPEDATHQSEPRWNSTSKSTV